MRFIAFLCLLGLCTTGCDKDPVYNVAPSFEPYVQRFIDEAAARGITIDFSDTGLFIQFREAFDSESSGVCRSDHHIEIEKVYWDDLSDTQREGLIFHELGHCELSRGHVNEVLSNGEWKSRMRGYPLPADRSAVINYNGDRRDYYVDELFDITTPEPSWTAISMIYDDPSAANPQVLVDEPDEREAFDERLNLSSASNFEIELEVNAGFSESWVGLYWGGQDLSSAFYVVYDNANNVFIGSAASLWGSMFEIRGYAGLNDDWNKLTIRRVDDKYYIFINEQFVYWFDYKISQGNAVRSLQSGFTPPTFRNLQLRKLN
ncbi:MAG: putative metallopeptidase [Saprospiraceae bacterium]|nr:putative metallopeptidase [Saprospiraceae bacterium]